VAPRTPKATATALETASADAASPPAADPSAAVTGLLPQLLAAANAGDQAATQRLLAVAEQLPALWTVLGTLQHSAEQAWLKLMLGETAQASLAWKAIEHEMAQLRDELRRVHASPLERLLVDRIVVAWLQAHYADQMYAQQLRGATSLPLAEYLQRRGDRAQRQLLRAISALATVRHKLTPAQVNIAVDGGQQVNIAGAPPSNDPRA
jgi:hypothetical protein